MIDVLSISGNSECEVVSCVDIKDAYHSIPLTERSKEFCGILPYFGSPIYSRVSRSYLILFYPIFWQNPILSYFLGNVLFYPIFGHFAINFGIL